MNEEVTRYQEQADFFQLFSHPARLQILDELRRSDACVCHLEEVLERPQAYVSQQVAVLREAGVIEGIRDGLNVFYHIVDPRVRPLLDEVLGPAQPARCLPDCPCPKCLEEDACGC
jgi:ArsR family transcriptional regulator